MKTLKILILFVVVLFGCSKEYLARTEEELVGQKWSVLDTKIVSRDNENLSLNIQVKNFGRILDSLKLKKFNENQVEKKQGFKRQDYLTACIIGGCMLGVSACVYGYYGWELIWGYDLSMPERCLLIGLLPSEVIAYVYLCKNLSKSEEFDEKVLSYALIDKVCLGSAVVSIDKIKVKIEDMGFEQTYFTDEYGNIELKIDEIIPEQTEKNSVLNLIIQYEKLVDTVEINIMKAED